MMEQQILDYFIKEKIKAHNNHYGFKGKKIDYSGYATYLADVFLNDIKVVIELDSICKPENQKSFIEALKLLIDTDIKDYVDVEFSEDYKRIRIKQFDPMFKMFLAEKGMINLCSHKLVKV